MPIAASELRRDLIVVDEVATVRQVRDQVAATGQPWTYIVVKLGGGQYAVLQLAELIQALKDWRGGQLLPETLEVTLAEVPGLLASRAGAAIEQASLSTDRARELQKTMPGRRLVVVAEGQVIGLFVQAMRGGLAGVDLDWLSTAIPAPKKRNGGGAAAEQPDPGVLSGTGAESFSPPVETVPEKRWINAEIQDHAPAEPLLMGETYTLAFDVDTELRETAVGGGAFGFTFETGVDWVDLTVQLASEDFEIYTEPQKLRVPRTGKSRGRARFDIEPKHEGEGVINAVFLKDGNFIQLITLKLLTAAPGRPGSLADATALRPGPEEAIPGQPPVVAGRSLEAAFAVRPRDVNLTIVNIGTGFQVILRSQVAATAALHLTLPELEQMIGQVRAELLSIVHLEVGPSKTLVYQAGIDIPPEVNRLALQRLARAGFRLYQRLFYGPGADAQVNLLGDRLREMAQKERLKIQIFSQQFVLPWGILYLAEQFDPDQIDPERFLGLKHIIEHIPLQQNMSTPDDRIDSRPGLTVSLNVNTDIDRRGGSLIGDQVSYWDALGRRGGAKVIVRKTQEEVLRALADASTPDQILYFYCHAASRSLAEGGGPDASSLLLSGSGRLTLEDLNLFAPPRNRLPGAPLVFINACESAELSPLFYDGFVPYFMAKGARGVIGTECETPALFAAEWARRFFDHFLGGKSLGQAFLDLRREFYYKHNNLMGLLYALYCDVDTEIAPALPAA